MSDDTPSEKPPLATTKPSLREPLKRVAKNAIEAVGQARTTAKSMAVMAAETAKEVSEMANETAKGVAEIANEAARSALQIASEGAQVVAQLAEDGAKVAAQFAGDTAKAAGQVAKEVALQMAQAYLRKSSLTLTFSESQLNRQLRQKFASNPNIDHLTVYCGDDRITVAVDGHHNRLIYTVELDFDVLECKVSRDSNYLRVRQVNEELDAQFRQTNLIANWAAKQIGRGAFYVANRLPTKAPVHQMLANIPGVINEGPRLWRIDLGETAMLDFLNNRSWMVEKLVGLTDLSVLPGLTTLKDSKELLTQLVQQFEIRDLRVRPGRLEVLVGINAA
ncbi:MAG: hypothetical protein C0509_02375 [Acinetobacter sp.]|nr:hypothetical protein [Acinetobacter sp.]